MMPSWLTPPLFSLEILNNVRMTIEHAKDNAGL
jgi:hypothetical protein